MRPENEQELIQKIQHDDAAAFRVLLEHYQFMVFRLAFRMLCNEEEAKDAVQETFIKVWKNKNLFNYRATFSTWLYKIATNLCYDKLKSAAYRHQKQSIDINSSDVPLNSYTNETGNDFDNKDLADLIRKYTDTLTPKQKLVFTLCELEELTPDEVQTITGITPAKIKSNLYLARKNIRQKIYKSEQRYEQE